jgi:hypothetical protein
MTTMIIMTIVYFALRRHYHAWEDRQPAPSEAIRRRWR